MYATKFFFFFFMGCPSPRAYWAYPKTGPALKLTLIVCDEGWLQIYTQRSIRDSSTSSTSARSGYYLIFYFIFHRFSSISNFQYPSIFSS